MHRDPKECSRLAAAEEVPLHKTSSSYNTAVFPGAAGCTVLLDDNGFAVRVCLKGQQRSN